MNRMRRLALGIGEALVAAGRRLIEWAASSATGPRQPTNKGKADGPAARI